MNQKRILVAAACAAAALMALTNSSLATGGEETTRVWVNFQPNGKAQVGQALRQAGGQIHYEFDELNAFAVTVPARALAGLSRNPNVTLVEEDPKRYPMAQTTPYGIPMVQADQVGDGNTGNRKVCIIDSGYYLGHEDLPSSTVTGSADGGAGPWYQDGSGHGTHVAGTIAALNNSVGVVGVAPSGMLNLHIVRVFNDSGTWAYSSGLVAALNECRNAGSNVVSMSLGGSFSSSTENNAFNNAYNAGVLSIAAAGNAGTTAHSYPASYSSVVSVAAVDENKQLASFSQRNNQVELSAPGVGVSSTYPMGQAEVAELAVAGVGYNNAPMEGSYRASRSGALHDCGLGTSACSGASGRVCLISRGDVSFSDKVLNCQAGGGVAAVIYNNESGMLFGTLGGVSTSIPSVGITQADGQTLLGQLGASASVFVGAGNYAAMSGTSMATPHVSGVAALVWSYYPACTNSDLRNSLNATAEDLGAGGRDNSFGYGLVRAKAALDYLAMQSCAGGGGGDPDPEDPPPPPSCSAAGTSCTTGSECCSNKCNGRPGARTCR